MAAAPWDAPAGRRFRFVQVEVPWELGPPDGRYVLRGHAGEVAHVLVLQTVTAHPRRPLLRWRPRRAAPEPAPADVATTRATLVAAQAFPDAATARGWLRRADLGAEAAEAVGVLNGVVHAQRIATADPFVREIALDQALAVRVGIGLGEEVADGDWTEARALPVAPRASMPRRASALRPQERFAALLSGRDVALAAEELTLRARLDLDRGRTREAALQLRVALEAALAELQAWAYREDLAERLAELRDARPAVAAAANRALEGGLDEQQVEDVGRVVGRLEAALAARVAGGFE
ncbi:MAG TPA: hypothetical protein VFT50_17610 [Baekduia sp.]|nr:hypothetical protein [Baekduia sp.]